jgi:hypothetical protein
MPATLQNGDDANSSIFNTMFDAKGDITLKNVYFVNCDLSGVLGNNFLTESADNTHIVMDGCVLHPAGMNGIEGVGAYLKTYFTNNQVIDHGHQLSDNDGHFFNMGSNPTPTGLDTLLVENNTFVCLGMNLFQGGFNSQLNNVVKFNHNTIVFGKSQLDWADYKNQEYWTSNLFYDQNTAPYANSWQPMPGGSAGRPKPNLIYADTLRYAADTLTGAAAYTEVLPSSRPNFVQYNATYRAQGFYDLLTEMNAYAVTNSLPGAYYYPLCWPKDSIDCREAQMFNSTSFPNFKYGNTITDVDPQWTDSKIYDHEKTFIAWSRPASYCNTMGEASTDFPPAANWPQYWWIPSGDITNNSVWPVFDGTYSNSQLLHGAIEKNVPLGDLNWFPSAKAAVAAHSSQIFDYIKAGNTDQIDIGFSPEAVNNVNSDIISVSPNPAKNEISIKGAGNADITISSLDGKILKTVKNVSKVDVSNLSTGTYLITVKEGNNVSSQKLLIER